MNSNKLVFCEAIVEEKAPQGDFKTFEVTGFRLRFADGTEKVVRGEECAAYDKEIRALLEAGDQPTTD